MSRSTLGNILFSIFVFALVICVVELACLLMNRSAGVHLYFMYQKQAASTLQQGTHYNAVDSLIGYARSTKEGNSLKTEIPYIFKDGFVFYGAEGSPDSLALDALQRPLIVTLGGSTTDPGWQHSWPEQLAIRMKEKGIPGTVVNGGLGGFSSNQEILKLIRDVLEVAPDVVVSYHGVNDTRWVNMPYPMSSKYMQALLTRLVRQNAQGSLMPNTMHFIKSKSPKDDSATELTHGFKTQKSNAEYLVRNVRVMDAILKEFQIAHVSILQPFVLTGEYSRTVQKAFPDFYARFAADDTGPMYAELMAIKERSGLPMIDLTTAFDDRDGAMPNVYIDRCHLTPEGNTLIAGKIFSLLAQRGHITE